MQESRIYGSVRGAPSNGCPYRNQFSSCCARPAFLRRISARLSKELDGFRHTPHFQQGHRRLPSRFFCILARAGAETPWLAGVPRRFQARDPVRIIGSIAAGVNSILRIASGRTSARSPVAANRNRISGATCRWPAPSFIKLFACHRPRGQTKIYACDADCASGMLPLNRVPRSAKCLF